MIPRWSSAQAVLGIVVVSGRVPRVDRNGVWKTTGRRLLTFQLSALARIWDIGPCRGAWPACLRGICTTVCRREQSRFVERDQVEEKKGSGNGQRRKRHPSKAGLNEPEQDIEPENPGVVCVVHAPSLARMCRDEDPALDKIWVQNKKRPASVLAPWQKSSRHSARMRGRGRHPSSTPNQAKRSKILSFLLFTPLEALSATSVIQDINPPTRRISNIISNVKIYTRATSRPGCHFRRLWSSAGITNHLPKQKGKGGELSWCHSASQAAFEGLLNCSEGREHETIMAQLRNCDSDPIAGLHPLHHTGQHFVASKSAGRMAHDFHQSTDPDCINSMAHARGTPRGKGSFAMRQRSSSPCG